MAKPGIKEKRENKYSLSATGKVVVKNDKVLLDVSEKLNETQLEDINMYLKNLNRLIVDVRIVQKEVEEE